MVAYIQIKNHYQRGLQAATRSSSNNALTVNLELPLVLSDAQAARIADITLSTLWSAREAVMVWVSYQYLYLTPGDVIRLLVEENVFDVRLTQVELGPPGLVQLQGVREVQHDYRSYVQGGII